MSWNTSHDPARAGLPPDQWPPGILAIWTTAKITRPGPFRKNGGGKGRASATVLKSEKGLRRFLGHAHRQNLLEETSTLLNLLTPETLDGYFAHLMACGNTDSSVVGRFAELSFACRLMYPERDFRWITNPNGVPLTATLTMDVKPRFVPSSAVLLEWADELYTGGLEKRDRQIRWAQVRDALLIAILATRAPRRRALASLQLGKHIVRVGTGWLMDQEASLTKTNVDNMLPLSSEVGAMIDRYVTVERREMLRGQTSDAFWLSWYGRPLKDTTISGQIWRRTLDRFGTGFCTHRSRKCLATTSMMENPSAPLDGPIILGHRPEEMLKSYNLSTAIRAAHRNESRLRDLRSETEKLADLAFAGKI